MAPVTNHTIVVKINNVDRSGLLLADSLYIRSSIANGNDVAEFALRDVSQSFAPQDWDEVTVDVDGTRIFGGYIIQREADNVGAGTHKRTVWRVQCKDWSILLDRIIVNKQYKLTDDDEILSDLFNTYLGGEGFNATTNVDTVRLDIDINFEEITLREALNELAVRAGANWHIAPNKNLYWYAPTAPASAAFNIDTDAPNNTTTFNVLEGTLKKAVDASQIVNRVRVIGAEAASTALQTDTFAANGSSDKFGPLTKKPHSVWSIDYWVGGMRWIRYTSNIGYESNGDKLFADGGGHEIICNLELQTISIKHQNGDVPDNATNVVVKYYYTQPIEVTRDDSDSQSAFGRVFEQSIYDERLTSVAEATAYADGLLAEYAFGRESIRFDIARHGLLPGRKIHIKNALLDLDADYLIQEVQFRALAVSQNQFMVVASVQAGKFVQSLIDTLRPTYSAGARRAPAASQPGRLSIIAADLGEVVAGRAAFTDGGTAKFEWGTPNGATGAVIGLEDINNNAYGAAYIYEGGTVRAKLGRLTGLPNLGTVTPTGWGLYTTNGYFTGIVAASQMIGGTIQGGQITGGTITGGRISGGTVSGALVTGGTVSGNLITGGTLQATLGTIAGFTIANNMLWSNGGTIATGSIINSSNPGVYLTNTGLYGFGTLGLTFKIPTNPAEAPWFSSGTINNVVYEVYESAVMRTTENVFSDGGIQIDNSGIFGVNPLTGAGALLMENSDLLLSEDNREIVFAGLSFMLDSTTGKVYAEEAWLQGTVHAKAGVFEGTVFASAGQFSGTVSAAQITGGTISGALLTGNTITGITVSASDITAGTLSGVTISGNRITGGTIQGAIVSAGTVSGVNITSATMLSSSIIAGIISASDISASVIIGGTIAGVQITGNTISGNNIIGGTITGNRITGGTITGVTVTANNISGGTVTGSRITGGTITGNTITANSISGGTVSGALVSGGTVTGAVITASNGTVRIGEGYGIQFYGVMGGGPDDELKWRINGTAVASISASRSSGGGGSDTNVLRLSVANDGSSTGRIQIYSGANQVYIQPSQIYTQVGSGGSARWTRVNFAGVEARGDLYPAANTWNLGRNDNDNIWAGIYLKDAATGATRYFRINNGTVLIT